MNTSIFTILTLIIPENANKKRIRTDLLFLYQQEI